MVAAVLFDLDGTLFDRERSVQAQIAAQYDHFAAELASVTKSDYLTQFMALDDHGYRRKDDVYREIVRHFRIGDVTSAVLYEHYLAHYHDRCVAFPDTLATLERLAATGLRLGIITNGVTQIQQRTIAALRLDDLFSVVLISEAEGIRKPDPAIFRRAVEQLGVAPSEAVFVGDHPQVDVGGARSAGLRTIWKRVTHWEPPTEADHVVDSLAEIPEWLHKN